VRSLRTTTGVPGWEGCTVCDCSSIPSIWHSMPGSLEQSTALLSGRAKALPRECPGAPHYPYRTVQYSTVQYSSLVCATQDDVAWLRAMCTAASRGAEPRQAVASCQARTSPYSASGPTAIRPPTSRPFPLRPFARVGGVREVASGTWLAAASRRHPTPAHAEHVPSAPCLTCGHGYHPCSWPCLAVSASEALLKI